MNISIFEIIVKNNGVGIPTDKQSKLFNIGESILISGPTH